MYRVALLGSEGGIGSVLALLLKTGLSGRIQSVSLYDIVEKGTALELSHIPTPTKVQSYIGSSNLPQALRGADIVVVTAGQAIQSDFQAQQSFDRNSLFETNAKIIKELMESCATHCPKAHVLIVSNPVNSLVPLAHKIFEAHNISRPSIFGVTTLDVFRARTFVAKAADLDPAKVELDVVGGHSRDTIVPLFSTTRPTVTLSREEQQHLAHEIKVAGERVSEIKQFKGTATLSTAYSTSVCIQSLLDALDGKKGVVINAYVYSPEWKDTPYFSGRVELGPMGVCKTHPLPQLTDYEEELYKRHVEPLSEDISKGLGSID